MHLHHPFQNPPAEQPDFDARMNGPDGGLVNAWLAGLALRTQRPDLAGAAQAGELPVLPYRGGVDRPLKRKDKVGSLHYVAMWQALRGEDLALDTSAQPRLTCARHGVTVTYTANWKQWLSEEPEP